MKNRLFFIFIIYSLFSFGKDTVSSLESISYVFDIEDNYTLNTIKNKTFTPVSNAKIGSVNGVYWFKIKLQNKVNHNLIFNIKNSALQKKDIQLYDAFKEIKTINIGYTNPSILVDEIKGNCCYLKIKFKKQVYFPLKIHSRTDFEKLEQNNFLTNGFFLGFALMILLINLLFFYTLKERTFLLYSLFAATTILGVYDFEGVLNLFLNTSIVFYLNIILHFLISFTGAVFAYNFLNLNKQMYLIKYVSVGLLLITLSLYVIFICKQEFIYYALADFTSFSHLLLYWIIGVLNLKKRVYAKFFVIGYSVVLFSGILFVLPMNFGIKAINISLFTVKLGVVFEMIILTYAISFRVKKMHLKNLEIKEQLPAVQGKLSDLSQTIHAISFEEKEMIREKVKELGSKYSLTSKETEVLFFINQGITNNKVAKELSISVNTLKYHTRNIYQKLNINTKKEAVNLITE